MPTHRFVRHIPDLIHPEDYAADPEGRQVRIRIRITPDGIEVIGDAVRSEQLERMLEQMGAGEIEEMLCG